MYEVIKSSIAFGGYKLNDIQHKIKKFYMLGDLTEEQMEELLKLSSNGASIDGERPQNIQLIQLLSDRIDELEARVKALETPEEPEPEPDIPEEPDVPTPEPEEPEEPEYEAWKPWDGISKDYQYGKIVTHNGKIWKTILASQNVWEPGAPGTENFWIIYTPET